MLTLQRRRRPPKVSPVDSVVRRYSKDEPVVGVPNLALYVGMGELYDKAIALKTGSIVTHTEIWVDGVFYSSSPRDRGVRAKHIDWDRGKWWFIPMPWLLPRDILNRFQPERGKGYDYISIFTHFLTPKWFSNMCRYEANLSWYCSELCYYLITGEIATCIKPVDLAKVVLSKGSAFRSG